MRFKYTFQKIVDLKESEKTQAEWMLSEAFSQLNEHLKQLQQLLDKQTHWEQKLEQSVTTPTSLQDILTIQHYIDYYKEAIVNKNVEIKRAKKVVETRRAELAFKMKEEKVWLKAKDNEYEKFKHNMQIKEQNELDEMASIRYIAPTP